VRPLGKVPQHGVIDVIAQPAALLGRGVEHHAAEPQAGQPFDQRQIRIAIGEQHRDETCRV
jgi:hypothetical protein